MKTIFNGKLAAVPVRGANAGAVSNALATRLSELARTMRGACAQMFGIPDYERYIEHMASHHPCDPLLSRREFFIGAIDRKYSCNGPRCC
jgi:uncharacterized short protein YbdD (DUF466 family)